jgi:hypothetical protein
MTQVPPAARPPLVRRPALWLAVAAAVLVATIAVVLGLALAPRGGDDAAGRQPPTTTPPPTTDAAGPPPTVTAPPAETPTAVAIPAACENIYTRDWTPEFGGLVLNPAWTADPDSGVHLGSRDDTAVGVLESTTHLTCKWGHPNGGSDRGLTTNVLAVAAQQAVDLRAHFEAVGYSCYDELEGIRCVVETEPTDDGQSGESHFFREGIWIATLWVNAGPEGYTHDIVAALFA